MKDMEDIENFHAYLLEKHISKAGKRYSRKMATDMISRLKLAKSILGRRFTKSNILNEDSFWKLAEAIKDARKSRADETAYHLYSSYVSALRHYRDYLERIN